MKAILKAVGKIPQIIDINGNAIEELQATVGGYVEAVNIGNGCIMLCDEEGKMKGKPYNFDLGNDKIVGDVLFTQDGGNGEFTDIDDANIKTVLHFFDRTPYTT